MGRRAARPAGGLIPPGRKPRNSAFFLRIAPLHSYLGSLESRGISPPPDGKRLNGPRPPLHRHISRLAVALAVAVAAACGGDAAPAPEGAGPPELEGSALEAGVADRDWSLLAVPRDGGTVQARSVADPSRVVWEGEAELPAAAEIHLLQGPLVVLRTAEGVVHRYDPRADDLSRIGTVAPDSRWSAWDRYGVFADSAGSLLLEIGPDGSWRYELSAPPTWAAPVEGGRVAALVGAGPEAALWLVARGSPEPAARQEGGFAVPGMSTAWGKRLVLTSEDGSGLRFVTVSSLTGTDETALGGPVSALAASPSSHEIYAGVDAPPRLVRVNRFVREAEEMVSLPRPAREIRPAVLGDFLLVDDGGDPLMVSLGGEAMRRVAGAWRPDLPMGTPDGRVLLARDGRLLSWDPESGEEARTVDAPADRWWTAVPWNPAPPPVVSESLEDERMAADLARADSVRDSVVRALDSLSVAPPETAAAGDTAREGPPAGFYAVVVAARERQGVQSVVDGLADAGYPTAVQPHEDDAGQTWYRGLVGPYRERSSAEAAARQLRREREMSVWVTEVRAATPAEDIFR